MAAYYLAQLLPLEDNRPVFASIAAVISLGASYQQRGRRAAELIAGVVLGLTVADLIINAIGNGPLQIGLMIILAMSAAVILGGGELLVSEAAVSALLLASIEPTNSGYSPDRFLEALTGGAVALAVGVLFFPPDPTLIVGRAAQSVFRDLGETLEGVATALAEADSERAERALEKARAIDADLSGARGGPLHRARDDPLRPSAPRRPRPARALRAHAAPPGLRGAQHARARAPRPALHARPPRRARPPDRRGARARPGGVDPGRRPRRPAARRRGARPRAQRPPPRRARPSSRSPTSR